MSTNKPQNELKFIYDFIDEAYEQADESPVWGQRWQIDKLKDHLDSAFEQHPYTRDKAKSILLDRGYELGRQLRWKPIWGFSTIEKFFNSL